MNASRIGNSAKQRREGVESPDIELVRGLRLCGSRFGSRTSHRLDNVHGDHAIVVSIAIAVGELLSADTCDRRFGRLTTCRLTMRFKKEPIVRRAGFERLAAAVEVWLFQIRAVVLGAERVAVAAVVAVVGEVGDLVGLFQLEEFFVADRVRRCRRAALRRRDTSAAVRRCGR